MSAWDVAGEDGANIHIRDIRHGIEMTMKEKMMRTKLATKPLLTLRKKCVKPDLSYSWLQSHSPTEQLFTMCFFLHGGFQN